MREKPPVGVSRCLLGHAVRYDGDSRPHNIVIEQLSELFELVPVCPEVEAGLGVPRPPVQLTGSIEQPRMTGRNDPDLDVSDQIYRYCATRPLELEQLCGFVFKSRSPSCGLYSTPVFINGNCITESSRGLLARAMTSRYTQLPVIEETELENRVRYQRFVDEVLEYRKTRHSGHNIDDYQCFLI
jgi:uncharacterized protein YbbK (DUF523 family)